MFTSTFRKVSTNSFSSSSFLDLRNLLGNGGGVTYAGMVGLGRGMVIGGSLGLGMGRPFVAAGLVFGASDGSDIFKMFQQRLLF